MTVAHDLAALRMQYAAEVAGLGNGELIGELDRVIAGNYYERAEVVRLEMLRRMAKAATE